jgi:MoxR-like ATPase
MPAPTAVQKQLTISPTKDLGVHGWEHLDPLLLAALQLEAPVLLVGRHGTAKTLLAERVARHLGGQLRHYNASLINYDDLVGIPLPDESGGLRFVGTEGAVWDATFVFFDEVNRCRPDLQNKMFPIVHERRVAGLELPKLRHRWAAMNPPTTDGDGSSDYLGVETLDAALADRFWFVITVPTWRQLTKEQQEALVRQAPDERATSIDLLGLIDAVTTEVANHSRALEPAVVRYVVSLVDILHASGIELSPRRAALLRRSIISTWAAGNVLGRDLPLEAACELVLLNGLPHWASEERPGSGTIVAAHAQAWDLAQGDVDPKLRRIFAEADRVERVRLALDLQAEEDTLARCVTGALTSRHTDAERVALASVLTEALRRHTLTPAAWSALAEWSHVALTPNRIEGAVAPGSRMEAWRTATSRRSRQSTATLRALEDAIVNGCGPDLLHQVDLSEFRRDITSWLDKFPIEQAEQVPA